MNDIHSVDPKDPLGIKGEFRDRIRWAMDYYGVSLNDLAKELGLQKSSVKSGIDKPRCTTSVEVDSVTVRIIKFFGQKGMNTKELWSYYFLETGDLKPLIKYVGEDCIEKLIDPIADALAKGEEMQKKRAELDEKFGKNSPLATFF